MSSLESELSRLHHEMVAGLIRHGVCPPNLSLSERIGVSESQVEDLLQHLSGVHGVVLHPHIRAPWILHPFSLTPTINWIQGDGHGWWAPCVWCALGVAALVGGELSIHTRYGAEADPLIIPVKDGQPSRHEEVWVHFAIPPAKAWANVHEHCSLVLPFRTPGQIQRWCQRHRLPQGEAVPLGQVARLAQVWYGRHADPDWRKWTVAEAQEIFHGVGLRSSFWDLGAGSGRF